MPAIVKRHLPLRDLDSVTHLFRPEPPAMIDWAVVELSRRQLAVIPMYHVIFALLTMSVAT